MIKTIKANVINLIAELPKDSYDDEKSEIEVAKKMMRSGTETEIPERLEKAGKKAGDSKRMGKKSAKKTGKKSNGMTQKGGKPGKKAVIPMKGATIFARKKGTDLWYRYTFVGKGKKQHQRKSQKPTAKCTNRGRKGNWVQGEQYRMAVWNQ